MFCDLPKFVKKLGQINNMNVTLKETHVLTTYLRVLCFRRPSQERPLDTTTARWKLFKEIPMSNVKGTQRKLCIIEAKITQFRTQLFILLSHEGRDVGKKVNKRFTS